MTGIVLIEIGLQINKKISGQIIIEMKLKEFHDGSHRVFVSYQIAFVDTSTSESQTEIQREESKQRWRELHPLRICKT